MNKILSVQCGRSLYREEYVEYCFSQESAALRSVSGTSKRVIGSIDENSYAPPV